MSAKEILHSIVENDYATANEKVQRELQVRAYQKVQEMKPSIMKKRFGESFEDDRDEDDLEEAREGIVKTVDYRGFTITVYRNRGGMYTAKNDSGEPYAYVKQFRRPEDAIKWDKKNIDQMLDESVNNLEEKVDGWIAFHPKTGEELHITKKEASSLYKAKQYAVDKWNLTKSQERKMAIAPAVDESVQLDEELKLGNRDKKVITAFTNQEADESKKLKSTGKRLDIMAMGGTSVAYWKDDSVMLTDLGSKAAQTVQNKIKKEMPSNKVFHE